MSPDEYDLTSSSAPSHDASLLDPKQEFAARASKVLSRRAALGTIFGSLAAAGGAALLHTPDRTIVGPTVADGPTPFGALHSPYGGLPKFDPDLAGNAELVDLARPGLITKPPQPLPSFLKAPSPDQLAAGDQPLSAPPDAAPQPSPTPFVIGKGRYTPADLAYIDREAPKTDRGLAAVRGLWLINPHTKEEVVTLFWSVGAYDNTAYSACCELMRDWRERQTVAMDPRLFHLLWAIQRNVQFSEPLIITSGFRTVKTNRMLQAEGAAVNSQHLRSRASDIVLGSKPPGDTARVAQQFGVGGLGYYKRFTHIDTGPKRSWIG